jgi:hypothetical protein
VIATALAFAPRERLAAAVLDEARLLAAETGLDGCPEIVRALDDAAAGQRRQVTDEDELGLLLRRLNAEVRAASQSRSDYRARENLLTEDERRAWAVRSSAARAIALVVSAPVEAAGPEVLSRRLDPNWRRGFMARLGDLALPADAVERLSWEEAEWFSQQSAAGQPVVRPTRPGHDAPHGAPVRVRTDRVLRWMPAGQSAAPAPEPTPEG